MAFILQGIHHHLIFEANICLHMQIYNKILHIILTKCLIV